MDNKTNKKTASVHFLTVCERIKSELGLRNDPHLYEMLGIPQSTFSRRKSDPFPVEWAYKIELSHGLLTRWIMTGEGPKRMPDTQAPAPPPALTPANNPKNQIPNFLIELSKWAFEISETANIAWLEKQLETCLPTWKIWREQNKSGATGTEAPLHQDQMTERKVA